MTDTFTWRAHATSSGGGDFTLEKAKFGDGYQQTVEWGLNSDMQKWSVVVGGYHAEIQAVIDFIRAHKGEKFLWTPPFSAQGYFQCDGYRPVPQGVPYYTLSLEFYQVAGP